MLCNTYQQGYNIRSKLAPQKDKHVVPGVQTFIKSPERKKVQLTMKVSVLESYKVSSPFSLEHEISKIKIHIPLTELVKKNSYRSHILKCLHPSFVVGPITDVINLQHEKPTIILGPIV